MYKLFINYFILIIQTESSLTQFEVCYTKGIDTKRKVEVF
jgi:hypothetical protein